MPHVRFLLMLGNEVGIQPPVDVRIANVSRKRIKQALELVGVSNADHFGAKMKMTGPRQVEEPQWAALGPFRLAY